MCGYPPKTIDFSNPGALLESSIIRSGDVLIIEGQKDSKTFPSVKSKLVRK